MILWERNSPVTTARQSSAFPLAARHDFGCYVSLLGESKYVGHNWNWFLTGAPIRNNWIFQNSCRKRGGNRSIVTSDWARGGAGRCRSCSKKKLSPKPFFHHFEHFWKKFKKKSQIPKKRNIFRRRKKIFFHQNCSKMRKKNFQQFWRVRGWATVSVESHWDRALRTWPSENSAKSFLRRFEQLLKKLQKKNFFFSPKTQRGDQRKKKIRETQIFFSWNCLTRNPRKSRKIIFLLFWTTFRKISKKNFPINFTLVPPFAF